MPKGAQYIETGILHTNRHGYSLELDGGGTWQLDVLGSPDFYLGKRVTVEGVRSGFNLIDVQDIRLASDPPRKRPRSIWERIVGR